MFGSRSERNTQAADMDVDGAVLDIDVVSPDAVEQLLARIDASRDSPSGNATGETLSASG
jgi:hypothetical protein